MVKFGVIAGAASPLSRERRSPKLPTSKIALGAAHDCSKSPNCPAAPPGAAPGQAAALRIANPLSPGHKRLNAEPHCRELQDRKGNDRAEARQDRNGCAASVCRTKPKQRGQAYDDRKNHINRGKCSSDDSSHT